MPITYTNTEFFHILMRGRNNFVTSWPLEILLIEKNKKQIRLCLPPLSNKIGSDKNPCGLVLTLAAVLVCSSIISFRRDLSMSVLTSLSHRWELSTEKSRGKVNQGNLELLCIFVVIFMNNFMIQWSNLSCPFWKPILDDKINNSSFQSFHLLRRCLA